MSVPCMSDDWATRLLATRAIFIDFSGKRSAAVFIIADSRFIVADWQIHVYHGRFMSIMADSCLSWQIHVYRSRFTSFVANSHLFAADFYCVRDPLGSLTPLPDDGDYGLDNDSSTHRLIDSTTFELSNIRFKTFEHFSTQDFTIQDFLYSTFKSLLNTNHDSNLSRLSSRLSIFKSPFKTQISVHNLKKVTQISIPQSNLSSNTLICCR